MEDNAALIAEHLQAAGDLHAAYGWHMRAGAWSTIRDIERRQAQLGPRTSHRRRATCRVDPDQLSMRIAPRTMLCGTAWRVHVSVAGASFEELRELCNAAGDKASLAIAMAGLVMDHTYHARIARGLGAGIGSHGPRRVSAIPNLTVGLSLPAIYAKIESGEWSDVLRWSQTAIDLADGDPTKGNILLGSPLAVAHTSRGMARWWLGRPGWRDDQRHGLGMALRSDPVSLAVALPYVYGLSIPNGVLRPDDSAVREIEDSLRIAERSGDDLVRQRQDDARLCAGAPRPGRRA